MKKYSKEFPIEKMAEVLRVSRNGYYKYINRKESITKKENTRLYASIIEIHKDGKKKAYGSPRICKELNKQGKKCSIKRIAKIMRENHIIAINKKAWKKCKKAAYDTANIAPNLLNQNFTASKENLVWVSDITYVSTAEGWLYVSSILDLYSRKIVGLSMDSQANTDLIKRSLDQAICHRMPNEGLVLHSDRGCQYTSSEYKAHTLKYGVVMSMSATGNCFDNAAMESFFGTLKTEHISFCSFKTRKDAMQSIFEYVEVFYNRQRLHSTLGYLSPCDFEKNGTAKSVIRLENEAHIALPVKGEEVRICYV